MPDTPMPPHMNPSRPYLIRALNEWMLDNSLTPYLLVDAGVNGVIVPEDYVSNGQIVLNISPGAVRQLLLGDDAVEFNARFGGVPMQLHIPIIAVLAIYAKENGQGMMFGNEPGAPDPDAPNDPPPEKAKKPQRSADSDHARPALKVVK